MSFRHANKHAPSPFAILRTAVLLSCLGLCGCSKVRDVLIVNRFDCAVKVVFDSSDDIIPAGGHAFLKYRTYMPSQGTDIHVYTTTGQLLTEGVFVYDDSDTYQDDLIVVDLGP